MNGLKSSKACGPNSIPSRILDDVSDKLIEPLTEIVNMSLKEGVFPTLNKEARVCPTFKKGDRFQCENYRPISLLSNISKIFERVVYNRIEEFLTSTKQLYPLQFGFRKNFSTNHALLSIVEQVREAMDSKMYSCGVFIDLEKAFDTVNHEILLQKLNYYGIRGIGNAWLSSYLSGRNQTVRINGETSSNRAITCGVPQGSILGPLLFLIYINDMHLAVRKSTIYHFADDTNLLFSCKSVKELRKTMNNDLKCLYEWLCANRLSLNTKKTEFIIFTAPRSCCNERVTLTLNRTKLYESSKIKYLGLILDNKLNWKAHVNELAKKLSRSIGLIAKIRPFCTLNVLRSLYFSLFNSHLSYGLSVWGGSISEILLSRLKTLQNRTLRIIFSSTRDNPVSCAEIRKTIRILTIEDQMKVQISSLMWDYDHNLLPENLSHYFKRSNLVHNYETRGASKGNLFFSKVNTASFGIKSFKYQGVKTLNHLLNEKLYQNSKSKASFLKKLKSELILQY